METSQYITFKLGEELFAVSVHKVREVLDLSPITKVPMAPSYMKGVVDVRGTAIPVVDLRLKFGLPAIQDSLHSRIIVLELSLEGVDSVLGGLADSVHDVIEFEESQIKEPPRIGMRWKPELIQGIAKLGDTFVLILDIAKAFSMEDLRSIEENSIEMKELPETALNHNHLE